MGWPIGWCLLPVEDLCLCRLFGFTLIFCGLPEPPRRKTLTLMASRSPTPAAALSESAARRSSQGTSRSYICLNPPSAASHSVRGRHRCVFKQLPCCSFTQVCAATLSGHPRCGMYLDSGRGHQCWPSQGRQSAGSLPSCLAACWLCETCAWCQTSCPCRQAVLLDATDCIGQKMRVSKCCSSPIYRHGSSQIWHVSPGYVDRRH